MNFTSVIQIRDSFQIKQFEVDSAETALRESIASLPYDDGSGPFDEELDFLQEIASGEQTVTLLPVTHCKNTWLWLEGARYEPQYIAYLVKTDIKE